MLSQNIAPVTPYVKFDDLMTPLQCKQIINIAQAIGTSKATTSGGAAEHRRSSVAWIHQQEGIDWLFEKLRVISATIHGNWFPCETTHFAEPLQVTHYQSADSGHYEWHPDIGDNNMRTRKLSVSILLSNPGDFVGGQLELFSSPEPTNVEMKQGTAAAFPSYAYHRVLPLTQGERWSLVAWLHGPVWR